MDRRTRDQASRAGAHRFFLRALPYVVMGAIVGVELSPQAYMGFLALLSLGPALASVSRGAVATALIGVEALVLCAAVSWYDEFYRMEHGSVSFVAIIGVTAVGVVASAGRQRRERQLADIRVVAEVAQAVLQRPAPREVPGAQIAVRYMSATAAARIGGDLYEVIATPERVRLILGDVQGKGVAAVRTASMVVSSFREAAYDADDLPEIAARIERSLRHQAPEQEFVTAVLAQLTPGSGQIEILNCGHPSPMLVRDRTALPADPLDPGLPLGLSWLADGERQTDSWQFGPGDQILFYTDGISEARDKAGRFYPLAQCGAILSAGEPEAALDLLRDRVVKHVGHTLTDDAAMLLVKSTALLLPAAPRPGAAARNGKHAKHAKSGDAPGQFPAGNDRLTAPDARLPGRSGVLVGNNAALAAPDDVVIVKAPPAPGQDGRTIV
ncbi:MAG TPA: PP2C family protein-serine/threonine phosphatase [Trebonia sp.]|nr:PP2C family protein-serine/threonine phosphatase [Trebonia sp.]